jgi:hypothetical protein
MLELPPLSGRMEIDWSPLEAAFDRAKAEAAEAAGTISRSVSDLQLKPPQIDLAPVRAEAAQLASVVAESVAGAAIVEPPAIDLGPVRAEGAAIASALAESVAGAAAIEPPPIDLAQADAEGVAAGTVMSRAVTQQWQATILPPIVGMATADVGPLESSLAEAGAQVQAFAGNATAAFNEVSAAAAKMHVPAPQLGLPAAPGGGGVQQIQLPNDIRLAAPSRDRIDAQLSSIQRDIAGAAGRHHVDLVADLDDRRLREGLDDLAKDADAKLAGAMRDADQQVQQVVNAPAAAAAASAGVESGKGYSKGFLDSLNAEVGKRSSFGKVAKLLSGAGVVGGLAVASNLIDQATVSAEKFAIALGKGDDAAREGTAELLRSLPIVGKLGEAGERIWNIVSGESAYVAKIKEATDWQERHLKTVRDLHDEIDGFTKGAAAGLDAINAKTQELSLGGLRKQLFDLGREELNQYRQIFEEADKVRSSDTVKAAQNDVAEATKKLRQLQQQMTNVPATIEAPADDESGTIRGAPNPAFATLQGDIAHQQHIVDQAKRDLDAQLARVQQGTQQQVAAIGELAIKQKGAAVLRAAFDAAAEWFKPIVDAAKDAKEKAAAQLGAIKDALGGARRDVLSFGFTDEQKKIFDFTTSLGAPEQAAAAFAKMSDAERQLVNVKDFLGLPPDAIAQYDELVGKLETLKKSHDMHEEVDRWRDSLKGPVERYDEMIEKLKQWRKEGAISVEDFQKGVDAAKDELEKSTPAEQQKQQIQTEPKLSTFIRAASAEALKFSFSAERQGQQQRDPVPQKQLTELERHRRLLQTIADRLDTEVV